MSLTLESAMAVKSIIFCIFVLLSVAQLAERRIVVPKVVSSILTRHLILIKAKRMKSVKEIKQEIEETERNIRISEGNIKKHDKGIDMEKRQILQFKSKR